jgi:hypothetical protein
MSCPTSPPSLPSRDRRELLTDSPPDNQPYPGCMCFSCLSVFDALDAEQAAEGSYVDEMIRVREMFDNPDAPEHMPEPQDCRPKVDLIVAHIVHLKGMSTPLIPDYASQC